MNLKLYLEKFTDDTKTKSLFFKRKRVRVGLGVYIWIQVEDFKNNPEAGN